eukprot:1059053-Prymnesium_polylepis.1
MLSASRGLNINFPTEGAGRQLVSSTAVCMEGLKSYSVGARRKAARGVSSEVEFFNGIAYALRW